MRQGPNPSPRSAFRSISTDASSGLGCDSGLGCECEERIAEPDQRAVSREHGLHNGPARCSHGKEERSKLQKADDLFGVDRSARADEGGLMQRMRVQEGAEAQRDHNV